MGVLVAISNQFSFERIKRALRESAVFSRMYWRMRALVVIVKLLVIRKRYLNDIERCRSEVVRRKLKVGFVVSDISKWKCQLIFDKMAGSRFYNPFIIVVPSEREVQTNTVKEGVFEKGLFFESRHMSVLHLYGNEPLSNVDADILFYQQPWELIPAILPMRVSKTMLTFYIPYYVVNNWDKWLELGNELQHHVYGYIVPNRAIAKLYEKESRGMKDGFVGEFLPLGHPILDASPLSERAENSADMVIYAPHWTFEYGKHKPKLHYSTFLENGEMMLKFAKEHSNIKWVFKPHPNLRVDLYMSGAMSKSAVDKYYAEWENIGVACYTSEYVDLFNQSTALITDCGSFLTEYACTGNPIIRPINPKLNTPPHPVLAELYGTYYETHANEELASILDRVIVKHDDFRRESRIRAIKKLDFCGEKSTHKIINYLDTLLRVNG